MENILTRIGANQKPGSCCALDPRFEQNYSWDERRGQVQRGAKLQGVQRAQSTYDGRKKGKEAGKSSESWLFLTLWERKSEIILGV